MTNFSELSRTWQHLHALAPEAFAPITDDESLARATAFLRLLDREMGEAPDHPLRDLADGVMERITTYETARFPIPDADGPTMLAFYLEQRNLTQRDLEARTGIRQSVISQLLNRKRPFTADHARALGRAFGVAPGMFL